MKGFSDDARGLLTQWSIEFFRAVGSISAASITVSLIVLSSSWAIPAIAKPSEDRLSQAVTDLKLSERKWIEVRLRSQRLVAWQGDRSVYAVTVSTGKYATPTPVGTFKIQTKIRLGRMQGADYDVDGVPYIMYYHGGYGIHGADWHHNFGRQVSHGCTNVAVDHAKWLFNWAAVGTPVVVRQ